MASSARPIELAKELPASASSLAVLPLATNTAEAVDMSVGASIRGLLLLLLLLLVLLLLLLQLLRRVQVSSPAETLNARVACIMF